MFHSLIKERTTHQNIPSIIKHFQPINQNYSSNEPITFQKVKNIHFSSGITAISNNVVGTRTGEIHSVNKQQLLQFSTNYMEQVNQIAQQGEFFFKLTNSKNLHINDEVIFNNVNKFVILPQLLIILSTTVTFYDFNSKTTLFKILYPEPIYHCCTSENDFFTASKTKIYQYNFNSHQITTLHTSPKDVIGLIFTNNLIIATIDSIYQIKQKRELFLVNQRVKHLQCDENYIYLFSPRRMVVLSHKLTVLCLFEFEVNYRCFCVVGGVVYAGNQDLDVYSVEG